MGGVSERLGPAWARRRPQGLQLVAAEAELEGWAASVVGAGTELKWVELGVSLQGPLWEVVLKVEVLRWKTTLKTSNVT